jgi:hypothetical protein
MLDVHPPEKKIHGIRDFFLHLFTITIGLLIALALEGCAERIHQHHLRDEADRKLQQEIRDNVADLSKVQNAAARERQSLTEIIKFLQARRENKAYDLKAVTFNFTSSTLSDASWRTATATGALSFMEYARVQQFASAYGDQELFTRLELETLDNYLQLSSHTFGFDSKTLSSEEAKAALPDVKNALSHLTAMNGIATNLQLDYQRALEGKR